MNITHALKKNALWKPLALAAALLVICAGWLILHGRTCTLEIPAASVPADPQQLQIIIEQENGRDILRCTGTTLEQDALRIHLEAVQQGRTFISIGGLTGMAGQGELLIPAYVHPLGIISLHQYLGEIHGGLIVPIALTVFLACALYWLLGAYRAGMKESLYQYRNIACLGLMIFLAFALIYQGSALFQYRGLYDLIDGLLKLTGLFSVLALPIALIVSLLVIISNVVLVRREGFNYRNLLGLMLGALLCLATLFPSLLEYLLYHHATLDVHNQASWGVYVHTFVDTAVYILVVYLECVLLATILLSVRAARRIPRLDKDYMLILGCQIRRDGTLTRLLQSRVDRALAFDRMQQERTGKALIFVPSGGQGSDEVMAEAQAMKRYLLEKGVPEERILAEDQSTNTYENIKLSAALIHQQKADAVIAFSTTNYHVFRAGALAHRLKLPMEGVGAPTKAYFWINAFIREFIAALVSERKKHLAMLCAILLLTLGIIGLMYVSNVF